MALVPHGEFLDLVTIIYQKLNNPKLVEAANEHYGAYDATLHEIGMRGADIPDDEKTLRHALLELMVDALNKDRVRMNLQPVSTGVLLAPGTCTQVVAANRQTLRRALFWGVALSAASLAFIRSAKAQNAAHTLTSVEALRDYFRDFTWGVPKELQKTLESMSTVSTEVRKGHMPIDTLMSEVDPYTYMMYVSVLERCARPDDLQQLENCTNFDDDGVPAELMRESRRDDREDLEAAETEAEAEAEEEEAAAGAGRFVVVDDEELPDAAVARVTSAVVDAFAYLESRVEARGQPLPLGVDADAVVKALRDAVKSGSGAVDAYFVDLQNAHPPPADPTDSNPNWWVEPLVSGLRAAMAQVAPGNKRTRAHDGDGDSDSDDSSDSSDDPDYSDSD
jgi:hypothetical protein